MGNEQSAPGPPTPEDIAAAAAAAADQASLKAARLAQQWQGLTLVHFSAQLERFAWDTGARRACVPRIKGVLGVLGMLGGV
jgi:hypothetical protein